MLLTSLMGAGILFADKHDIPGHSVERSGTVDRVSDIQPREPGFESCVVMLNLVSYTFNFKHFTLLQFT